MILSFLHIASAPACSSQPCMNDGTCYEAFDPHEYYCLCTIGWTGQMCETHKCLHASNAIRFLLNHSF